MSQLAAAEWGAAIGRALVAVGFAMAALYCGHALSSRYASGRSAADRWAIAAATWLFGSIVGFELLAAAGAFHLVGGISFACVACLSTFVLTRCEPTRVFRGLLTDWRRAAEACLAPGPGRAVRLLGGVLVCGLLLRACVLPPLGWDTATYHGPKVAMWLQSGGDLPLFSPGGLSVYRYYPVGGEAVAAWACLPMRSDLFWGLIEVLQWLLLVPALVLIAEAAGVVPGLRLPAALAGMTVPTGMGMLGSGYVEPTINLGAVTGLALLLIARKRDDAAVYGVFGAMALGAAAATKLTALALPVVAAVWWLAVSWRRPDRRAWWTALALGTGVAALAVLPWILRNIVLLGRPLGPYPAAVGSWVLGAFEPASQWYVERDWLPGSREMELQALRTVFDLEHVLRPVALGPLALLALVVGVGSGVRPRGRSASLALVGVFMAIPLALYATSGFSVVRLGWAQTSARFLFVPAALAFILSARWWRPGGRRLGQVVFALVASYHVVAFLWALPENWEKYRLVWAAPTLLAGLCFAPLSRNTGRQHAGVVLMAVLVIMGLQWRADRWRYVALGVSRVSEPHLADIRLVAQALDTPRQPRVVAFSAGPEQDADNEFIYFLYGRRFQNRVVYVAPTRTGEIPAYRDRSGIDAELLDESAWLSRLEEYQPEFLVCFEPFTPECTWAEQRPDRFQSTRFGQPKTIRAYHVIGARSGAP